MSETHEELEQEVIAQYKMMMRGLKVTMGQAWMQIDLTLPQMRTLLILAEGPLVIGQIAQRLGVGLSTGGHLVDRLVQAGLAARTEDIEDRRRTLAELTPKGEELLARLLSGIQQIQVWLHEVDQADLAAFLQGLKAINRIVSQKNGPLADLKSDKQHCQTLKILKDGGM
ncbi:MAG TPA: MarR family transcriptional regulator [Ktedonobacteraceae bacterium]|jgi:DNA-binding MarR family transcriptional regulator|nr:MarR family transcriptional regulator [Ktedonobacteraceae bacterium]